MLVERLMKQCQQERRIATQLMHIRKEKDTIRNNRIRRQQQYIEQRELEYQQALDREDVSDCRPGQCSLMNRLIAGACLVGGEGEKGTPAPPQEDLSQEHG